MIRVVNTLNDPASNSEGELVFSRVDSIGVDTASSVPDTSAKDQDANSTALNSLAETSLGPVTDKAALRPASSNHAKRLTNGACHVLVSESLTLALHSAMRISGF